MQSIKDSFSFDSKCSTAYIEELQSAFDKLEQLICNAGQFHNAEVSPIWEYATEKTKCNKYYTIANILTAGITDDDCDKINELIYSLESRQ